MGGGGGGGGGGGILREIITYTILSCRVSIKVLFAFSRDNVSEWITGNCSDFVPGPTIGGLSRCDAPDSSVLFDGNIPTLTGLDGDMWASQLLTLQKTNTSRREIIFDH